MSRGTLWILILIGGIVLAKPLPARDPDSSDIPLSGIVKSSNGKPMEGVAVSARADGSTFTVTVYTDQDGNYHFPPMAPPMKDGNYKVWVQAVGFNADRSVIRLSADKTEQKSFTLTPLQDFGKQMSAVEWAASLPENTPQDRRGKRILAVNCSTCHSLGTILQNRFDDTGWTAILNVMEKADGEGRQEPANRVNPFMHEYKNEIVKFLTRLRGPDSAALKYKPLPRPAGQETQIVVTEYDVSPGHLPGKVVVENGSDWSRGAPSHYESRSVHDVAVDHQGYVWFTDPSTPRRTLGKLDPTTGRVSDYTLLGDSNIPLGSHDVAVDQIGNIWFNGLDAPRAGRPEQRGMMVKFDPKSEQFQKFPVPDSLPMVGTGLLNIDSKGDVWESAEASGIKDPASGPGVRYILVKPDPERPGGAIKLDPRTGNYTFYRAVTPSSQYYGVVVDSDDNVWFTQPPHDRIGVVYSTGEVGEVVLPALAPDDVQHTAQDEELASKFEGNAQTGPPWRLGPRRGAADKNGSTVWFSASQGNRLVKIDIHTRKTTEYPMPYPYSFPYSVAVDKNHMVWVTGTSTDRLFKFNPFTNKFTAYLLPSRGIDSRSVSVDNRTNPPTIWLAYHATNKIARVQFRTNSDTP